ncbi:hypothetical protein PsorP6_013844 [Peronosclerospora sorghi]|uniref:Uncharacterized protein n=1 Tax=Peronosclerospora sorghi TaxID=230839 RepID=A0ACC0VIU7_9STRA|nr:hypothetical protein PsorP6_013844 [Peronosclerospora sorghi]
MEFEQAQAQAVELLIQQCVAAQEESNPSGSSMQHSEENATVLDLLAQTCVDAHAAVQELNVAEVATGLANAVAATQRGLRSVGKNVNAILNDPRQMHELCYHVKQTDTQVLEALLEEEPRRIDKAVMVSKDDETSALIVSPNEENVRNIMVFAENMCTMMDHALSTITQDELSLAAQLSLNIAQKLLEAGQSLFMSLSDEERKKVRAGDRSDHITIEEVVEDEQEGDASEGLKVKNREGRLKGVNEKESKRSTMLRMYVIELYSRTREEAVEHPFLAGALAAAGLPFIGFVIPVASLVALALVIEKYYPEQARLTLELCSNFIQMSKLWFLLLKVFARQVSVVVKECFSTWYEYASTNGFMATGLEMASTGCSLGFLGMSYLFQMAVNVAKHTLE